MPNESKINQKPDRYISFSGIDFELNMRRVIDHLRRYTNDPKYNNAFWQRFWERMEASDASMTPVADKLLLLHSHTYYMAELFEEVEDEVAQRDLQTLETECF